MKKLRDFYVALMVVLLACLIYFKELQEKGMVTVVAITLIFIFIDKIIINKKIKDKGVKKIKVKKFNNQVILIPGIGLALIILNQLLTKSSVSILNFLHFENGILLVLFLTIALIRKDIILLLTEKGIDYNYNTMYIKWKDVYKYSIEDGVCRILTEDPSKYIEVKIKHLKPEDLQSISDALKSNVSVDS